MSAMAYQIIGVSFVSSAVSGADQRKHQSSASLAFLRASTGDRLIPLTKGQERGKCFHSMTSWWTILETLVFISWTQSYVFGLNPGNHAVCDRYNYDNCIFQNIIKMI